jgi:transposase
MHNEVDAVNRLYNMDHNTHDILRKIAKRGRDGVARTRAQVLSQVARGQQLQQAADYAKVSVQYAREIVREYNSRGLASLPPRHGGGAPAILSRDEHEALAIFVRKSPKELGLPWTTWSVDKIREAAVQHQVIPPVCRETVRQALRQNGISYQRNRTWKHSDDPQFDEKWTRIRELYAKAPKRSAVICFDEFGPLECRPYLGRTWAEQTKVPRLPATYHRPHGVRHLLAFYDVHNDVMHGFFYDRKRGEEFLDFLKKLRTMYPHWMHLYVILDNFSPHLRRDIKSWVERNRIHLVYTATNASWMNRIEAEFTPLRKFALEGTFPETHEVLERQIFDYLTWRNSHKREEKLKKLRSRYAGRLLRPEGRSKAHSRTGVSVRAC